jgi:hypothetical protein
VDTKLINKYLESLRAVTKRKSGQECNANQKDHYHSFHQTRCAVEERGKENQKQKSNILKLEG